MPREKGGWGVVGEPVLLGLVAAFSVPGMLVGVAAFASLLARQPAYRLLQNYKNPQKSIAPQIMWLVLLWTFLFACLGIAWMLNGFQGYFLVPMFIALIPSFWQLKSDITGDKRNINREMLSSCLPGSFATSIALLGSLNVNTAWMLWVLVSARTVPTILYVKGRVDLSHKKQAPEVKILAVQFTALFLTGVLALKGFIPELCLLVIAVYSLRAVLGLRYPRPETSIKRLGYAELVLGIAGSLVMGISIAQI